MTRLFAIARNAFIETIRQPIYGVLILVTFAVLLLNVPLAGWTMGTGAGDFDVTDQQMLLSLGLSTLLVSGLFIAAFSAAGTLAREIEDRTILTVVSKPISRATVVIGKYLGVSGALALAFYLSGLVFLMTVRHGVMTSVSDPYDMPVIVMGLVAFALSLGMALFCNYFFGLNFAASGLLFGAILLSLALGGIAFVGKGWKVVGLDKGLPHVADLLSGMSLMLLAVLVFAAVAVAASTRLGQAMTLLICIAVFLIGSMSEYLFGRLAGVNPLAKLAYVLVPNLAIFYSLDAVTQGQIVPLDYIGLAAAYALCYIVALLALGMLLFQRRELEAREGAAAAPHLVSLVGWLGRGLSVAGAFLALMLPTLAGKSGNARLVLLAAFGLAVGAVINWMYWGWFGRGLKWTYFTTWLLVLGLLGISVADLLTPRSLLGLSDPVEALMAGLSLLVCVILVLPKTRDHFNLLRKRSGTHGLPSIGG